MSIFLGFVFYAAIAYTVGAVCDCVNMTFEASLIIGIGWPVAVPYILSLWSREYIVSCRKD